MTYRIRVTKGSRALDVTKGTIARVSPAAVEGYGVRVGALCPGGIALWFTGNRAHAPVLRVGQSIRLGDGGAGGPVVVAEVEEVYYPTPE